MLPWDAHMCRNFRCIASEGTALDCKVYGDPIYDPGYAASMHRPQMAPENPNNYTQDPVQSHSNMERETANTH
jgi:hypothetical protein